MGERHKINESLREIQGFAGGGFVECVKSLIGCGDKPAASPDVVSSIQKMCTEAVSEDFSSVREGLTKLVEAVHQEHVARSEGDNKLRDECGEAIQSEIDQRTEAFATIRQELLSA